MTITPHLLAGSAVAVALTDNIFLAFLLGFLLHFALDAIPHLDPGTFLPAIDKDLKMETLHSQYKPWPRWVYAYAVGEFMLIWVLVFLLFYNKTNFGVIAAGGLGGIFVDIIDNPLIRFHLKWPIFRQIDWLHHKLHFDLPIEKWFWGLTVQLIVIGVSIWYLLKF